jgi:hypothetical protein
MGISKSSPVTQRRLGPLADRTCQKSLTRAVERNSRAIAGVTLSRISAMSRPIRSESSFLAAWRSNDRSARWLRWGAAKLQRIIGADPFGGPLSSFAASQAPQAKFVWPRFWSMDNDTDTDANGTADRGDRCRGGRLQSFRHPSRPPHQLV